jgi:Mg-chelatase subunit ChlD
MLDRRWALWRRLQYGTGFSLVLFSFFFFIYMQYIYSAPTCFDNSQNGGEQGVDCGGACARICTFTVTQPKATWARSFRVYDGLYNAVAYIENTNRIAASPELTYTISLHDAQGLITERKGKTILPPDSTYPVFEARIETGKRVPTQTFITLDPVDMWLPATAGRNQFTVSERTLSGADTVPRLDAKIYNDSLTEADRVEVIATIFDAKGNALTSSRTFIDDFAPRSEAQAVFTWPEPIAKTMRSCEIPTDIVLAIDLSGSMNSDSENPPQPLTSVLTSANAFVNRMQPEDQVGIVTFATNGKLVRELTKDLRGAAGVVLDLSIDPKEEAGSTNPGEAFMQAATELNSSRHNGEARKVMVLLTDGLATAPDEEPETFALEAAQKAKDAGVIVYTIGLGESVKIDFVEKLASSPIQSYRAVSATDVDRIYKNITTSLCEDGAAVIDIVPKTDASFAPLQ